MTVLSHRSITTQTYWHDTILVEGKKEFLYFLNKIPLTTRYTTKLAILNEPHHEEVVTVFSEKTDVPAPWIFSFSAAVTLKTWSRSPNLISTSLCPSYISINILVRIQPLVCKILCRQESVMLMPRPTPVGSTPKSICPSPRTPVGSTPKSICPSPHRS